jgi:ribosomal protein L11 methyltransferase
MGRVRVLKVLDIGCGSGILAMAAAKAMPVRAVAVDLDPEAVRIAAGNIRLNGLSKNIRAGRSRGTDAHLVHRHAPYDLIMANIFAGPLCRMAPAIRCHLKPGGSVILAGMLAAQERRVLSAFRAQRLTPVARLAIGEWVILRCRR